MENKPKKQQVEEKNNNLKETVEDIKENLQDKTKELQKDIEKKSKELKKEFDDKTKDIKKELKEKSEDLKEELKEKTVELKEKTEEILKDIKDNSKKFDKKDIEENKAMACLSYIIAPVPYFTETKSKWVRYHAIQGMNLFIVTVLLALSVSIICSLIIWPFPFLKALLKAALYTFMVIYAIIGIVNVCNGEAKELPIINKFKFIKK